MNSMQDLNGFGQNFRLYNDDRSPQASFTTPVNQVVFLANTANSFVLPTGSDIISQRSISNVSVFQVDLGGTTGNVTWPTPLPDGVVSSVTSPSIYKVTGPLVKQYYDQIKAPTISFAANDKTKKRFPANLALGSNSTGWLTDVVWPFAGSSNTWSFANNTTSTNNDADNFNVNLTVVGSNLDPFLSNATVSLGNIAANTSLSVGSPDSNGNVVLTLTGDITNPRTGGPFPPFTYTSNISTSVTIQSTSGDVLTQTNIPLLVNVDGLSYNISAFGPGVGAAYIFNSRNLTHVSSGITDNFPTTITCSYPAYGGVYGYTVWVTPGIWNGADPISVFTGRTIVTGSLTAANQRAVIGSFTSSSQETYSIRIDQLLTNWATLTRPSQEITQPLTIVIQRGTGTPAPTPDDITVIASKTNVNGYLKTQSWGLQT